MAYCEGDPAPRVVEEDFEAPNPLVRCEGVLPDGSLYCTSKRFDSPAPDPITRAVFCWYVLGRTKRRHAGLAERMAMCS